jgi:hypothetical protein
MELHSSRHEVAQTLWAEGVLCPFRILFRICENSLSSLLFAVLLASIVLQFLPAQQKKMVIDGIVRMRGVPLPATSKIRVLHEDTSIARTIFQYDPNGNKFGVRLSSQDGFSENEKILFRVVVSAQDSFLARIIGPPLLFKGTDVSFAAPTTHVELFRNQLPSIKRSLPDTTINEGQELRYRLVATDRDADTVRYGLKSGPVGSKIDIITGMFSWKPTYEQSGEYRITFLVFDGHDEDSSRTARVIVRNVNRPPKFLRTLSDSSIREGDTLCFTLLAKDPDGDQVFFRPLRVPPGLQTNSETGKVTWTPTYEQAGIYMVQFTAFDGLASDTSRRSQIVVENVNRLPVFVTRLNDTTISENQELVFAYIAIDPDRDTISYSLRLAPEGATVTSTGLLTWRPTFTQSGNYTVIVSAHDQDSSVDAISKIRVLNMDRPPTPSGLYKPLNGDTIRLSLANPVLFSWNKSTDPDVEDSLRYRVRIWGPGLDTTLSSQADTVLFANVKPHLRPLSTYHWTVYTNDGWQSVVSIDTLLFVTSVGITASTELISQIPRSYYLDQELPDPFNPITTIRYGLPERSYVKLTIYNMLSEPLLVLVSGEKDAGVYSVTFDATELTSGAYMFRMDAHPLSGNISKDFVNTKKMFIVR